MPDLIAQGHRREERWRRPLPLGATVVIGRASGVWSVPWDQHVSREHVTARWDGSYLHIDAQASASNPVFFQGTQSSDFQIAPGQHFVIGHTTFTLSEESVTVMDYSHPLVSEQTFTHEYLRHLNFKDPAGRLDIISDLPAQIATAKDATELFAHVLQAIFAGIPSATAAAICQVDTQGEDTNIKFLHWDRPGSQALEASRRLISAAARSRQSTAHIWNVATGAQEYTEATDIAWAFCVPFDTESTQRWSLYIAGGRPELGIDSELDLREEVKFAEIVTTTVSSFFEVRELQRRESSLGQFFSTPVITALRQGDADEILRPKEVDATVLFCDLRGFTRATEQFSDDLLGLLQRVSDALGVLTRRILNEGGVIGDFHGDAAMGFWGWPLAQEDAASRAARAAISIFDEFQSVAQKSEHPLAQFRMGIGLASGRVVAGKIGTTDQVKVTAFGPAVNLASRLENMTKRLNASILCDAETSVRLSTDISLPLRNRRLAVVRPYGMDSTIDIHELLPTEDAYPLLSDAHIRHYESALEAFIAGDWNTAWSELHNVPAADPSKDLLTTYIASRRRVAPPDWDGVICLDSK